MEVRSKVVKIGRPKGFINTPDCLKIKNPNGRINNVDGPQYKKLLEDGYKPSNDGILLIPDENYKYTAPRKRGRPPGSKNKIQKDKIKFTNEKVQNPITQRLIKTSGVTFKNIAKKYYYNPEENKFNKNKFKIRESKSAVKGFTKQYTIYGVEGNDAVSFIRKVKPLVLSQL